MPTYQVQMKNDGHIESKRRKQVMARGISGITQKLIDRWIAEGRGQGEGYDYYPWYTIHDFPSWGRVHRIRGWKHGRVHHLLSDLERNVFLFHQFPQRVTDIREQYPLFPQEDTLEIAREIGVRHPTDPRTKYPVVMTTDLFLTAMQGMNITYLPITVKYRKDLRKPRVLEKLEIERWYWSRRNLKLKIADETLASPDLVRNMLWLHCYYRLDDLYPLTASEVDQISAVLTHLVLNEDLPLWEVARNCDKMLGLEANTGLAVVRHLLANQHWKIDMRARIVTTARLVLLNAPKAALYGERRRAA
jgi:hypothetical protein